MFLNKSSPVAANGEFLIEPRIIIATGKTIPMKINITEKKFIFWEKIPILFFISVETSSAMSFMVSERFPPIRIALSMWLIAFLNGKLCVLKAVCFNAVDVSEPSSISFIVLENSSLRTP